MRSRPAVRRTPPRRGLLAVARHKGQTYIARVRQRADAGPTMEALLDAAADGAMPEDAAFSLVGAIGRWKAH